MNRAERRTLSAKVLKIKGHPEDAQIVEDTCTMCAFVAVQVIGNRSREFTLANGNVIPLKLYERLRPPQGLKFPKSANKPPKPCPNCAASGQVVTSGVDPKTGDRVDSRVVCPTCAGEKVLWTAEDYAPLCQACAQFVLWWLTHRETLAKQEQGQASKIIIPGGEATRATSSRIILPGQG